MFSIPSTRSGHYLVLIVAEGENWAVRLSEDLPEHEIEARPYGALPAAIAALERLEAQARAEQPVPVLVVSLNEIAQQPLATRQRLAELQAEQELIIIGGRSAASVVTGAVNPVSVFDTLPLPFDYSEILGQLRLHLAYRDAVKKAAFADTLLACLNEAVMISDRNDRILWVNAPFTTLTGYDLQEVAGKKPRFMRVSQNTPEALEKIWTNLEQTGAWRGEIWNRSKDGGVYAVWLTVSAIKDGHGLTEGYISIFTDITARKIREQNLERHALHDALTGLANRLLLEDHFQMAIAAGQRQHKQVAVLFVDLDGFKPVNDRYGHTVGDQVLVQLGQRLIASVRGSDTVSRFGGDEFICLLCDLESSTDVDNAAQKILGAISAPFVINGQMIELTSSIGLSLFPEDGADFATLLKQADDRMYRAKGLGKNRYFR